MKTYIIILITLAFSAQMYSQFEVSLSGGITTPSFEESKMFKSTFNTEITIHYNFPFNFMAGVNVTIPSNMKLYRTWAEPQLQYPYDFVEYNTVKLQYKPIAALSFQYTLLTFHEKSSTYFGINGGLYQSRVTGEIKYASDGYSETFNLTRDKETDFGIAPKVGFRYGLTENILLLGELKYDIIFSEYKQHLFNANIGLAYVFK